MNWTNLELINGWVASEDDPPRYAITDQNRVLLRGSAIPPNGGSDQPCAILPRKIWPGRPYGDEYVSPADSTLLIGWEVHPGGELYVWTRHILEGL